LRMPTVYSPVFYNVDTHRGWWWHRVPATGPLASELSQYY
jgi:hypothetical protein